jgi:hypothetical protein
MTKFWQDDVDSRISIIEYQTLLNSQCDQYFPPELIVEPYAKFTTSAEFEIKSFPKLEQFAQVYPVSKKCIIVTLMLNILIEISKIKHLVTVDNIDKILGNKTILIHGTDANFSTLSDDPAHIISIINKMEETCKSMQVLVKQPDVDQEKLKSILYLMMEPLKKAMPDCKEALEVIKNNVDMIDENFGKYYEEYTGTGNPSSIIGVIIEDVGKKYADNPRISAQLQRIIKKLKDMIKSKGPVSASDKGDECSKLLDVLDKQFDEK